MAEMPTRRATAGRIGIVNLACQQPDTGRQLHGSVIKLVATVGVSIRGVAQEWTVRSGELLHAVALQACEKRSPVNPRRAEKRVRENIEKVPKRSGKSGKGNEEQSLRQLMMHMTAGHPPSASSEDVRHRSSHASGTETVSSQKMFQKRRSRCGVLAMRPPTSFRLVAMSQILAPMAPA
ncbi:hypothetical protein M8818_000658 [Zalaria obscura]|uniref:Uncharacterized protein n=1 Tax=Zalaria obscura TaxID=2024903 RepID=A0ACC3SLV3_9PEZI